MLARLPHKVGAPWAANPLPRARTVARRHAAAALRMLRAGLLPAHCVAPCPCSVAAGIPAPGWACVGYAAPSYAWAVRSPQAAGTYYALARWGYTHCAT